MSSGSIRAADADRDQVAEVLHQAYADGRIDDQEHSERLLAALRAKTFDDLIPLTADLVPSSPVPAAASSYPPAAATGPSDPDRITVALTDVKRVGPWRVRRRSNVNVLLGSALLDLTEASFDTLDVELNVTQLMGSLTIRVPAGFTVRDETVKVMGSTTIKLVGEPDPRCPSIVLRGTNVLGDIKIRGPKRQLGWKRALA
jgi:hypothetical protein